MTATDFWHSRAQRLSRVVAQAVTVEDFPLVKAIRLSGASFARIEGAAIAYLWQSLSRAYPDRAFTLSRTLIQDHGAEILELPNRTPNGVLLPRRESFLSFNLVHQALADAIGEMGLFSKLSLIQLPCNVRIVSGVPSPATEARPYSSAKLHTDVWNGEPISSILFNIPVLGDTKAVDLHFFEPRDFPEELRGPLSDYALGSRVTDSVEQYPLSFETGRVFLSDSLSLHKTVRRGPALRLSLDFRAIAAELLAGETADCSQSKANYVPTDVWRNCGSTMVLASANSLDAFQRHQRGECVEKPSLSIRLIDEDL